MPVSDWDPKGVFRHICNRESRGNFWKVLGWDLEEGLFKLMKSLSNENKEGHLCVGGQGLPHIGGEQEGRKRGYKSLRKQHARTNRTFSLVVNTESD